jgi:hypothetical protein
MPLQGVPLGAGGRLNTGCSRSLLKYGKHIYCDFVVLNALVYGGEEHKVIEM